MQNVRVDYALSNWGTNPLTSIPNLGQAVRYPINFPGI